MTNGDTLLEVKNLRTYFNTDDGLVRAVDDVSWSVRKGQTVAIVGESGCGKSATALSVMGLIPRPPGEIVSGEINFQEQDLCKLDETQMRDIRGNRIAMIFQEPMTSLNPVYTISDQIAESIRLHRGLNRRAAWRLAVEMLHKVGIADALGRQGDYPHQLSGGMRQRVMIAMALACEPALLIADEPTTALDVTIQAQILDLLQSLQAENGMSIVLITHDLGVVAQAANYVYVMYAGRIVEHAEVRELLQHPLHPYTRGLLECVPILGRTAARLESIPGNVPDPTLFPSGCRFHPRCKVARRDLENRDSVEVDDGDSVLRACAEEPAPHLREAAPGHYVACHEI